MTTIRRGWFHLASGAGVGRILGFLSNLLLSRWLGPAELGLFNVVTTTVQTSDTLVRCGGDYALNFEVGGYTDAAKAVQGSDFARAFVQLCTLITALICFGVVIWIWFCQGLFPLSLGLTQRFLLTGLLVLMIACEGISASAWEVLLVSKRTALLALRQGLFFPLRLLFAAFGVLCAGFLGAMIGWTLVSIGQCLWLKTILKSNWKPLQIWPLLKGSLYRLMKRGFPFYASNLLASVIFYPLLLKVASGSGLSDVGYLRVGQILQQIFAFLPATLVPVLFLKLRGEPSLKSQIDLIERPLRVIWLILLETLLAYCIFDKQVINGLFGSGFVSALIPTRLLLITALFESLAQLVVQPLLAAGKTLQYGYWQNGSALLAAFLGWLWIPDAGLAAYLVVRLLYVTLPLIVFGSSLVQKFDKPATIIPLAVCTISLLVLFLMQIASDHEFMPMTPVFVVAIFLIAFLQRHDLLWLSRAVRRT